MAVTSFDNMGTSEFEYGPKGNRTPKTGLEFKSDSNNLIIYGSIAELKAFMSHLAERFGADARLGDVLSGASPKVHEPKLNKDMRTEE